MNECPYTAVEIAQSATGPVLFKVSSIHSETHTTITVRAGDQGAFTGMLTMTHAEAEHFLARMMVGPVEIWEPDAIHADVEIPDHVMRFTTPPAPTVHNW